MSFAGAVRVCLVGWQARPSDRPRSATLPPIAAGRFEPWAQRDRAPAEWTIVDLPPPTDARRHAADAGKGSTDGVTDRGDLAFVCRVERLRRVRG